MSPTQYGETLGELIKFTQAEIPDCRFILIDPLHHDLNKDPCWHTGKINAHLPQYCEAIKEQAAKTDSLYIAAQQALEKQILATGPRAFGGDDAHPTTEGHVLLAQQVFRACCGAADKQPNISKGETVLFIGDSITDAGRRSAITRPYGSGYMRMWTSLLKARVPN